MNDFDFDELDKAVGSLATRTQDEHGLPLSEPAPELTKPSPAETVRPEPAKSVPVESRPTPVLAQQPPRPRLSDTKPAVGRRAFMDIVPPTPRRVPTRVGVSIEPVSKLEDIIPELKTTTPESNSINAQPAGPAQATKPEPSVPPKAATDAVEDDIKWPDPLDFNEDTAPAQKPAAQNDSEQPDASTPFLAQAKVEKRPLGAYSTFAPEPVATPPAPQPEPEPKSAVDELLKDEPTKPEPAPLAPQKTEKTEKSEPEEPSKPDVHGAAMMAIPQQYRTEYKGADKSSRSIFDTKEYHPPLLEAAVQQHHGNSMWIKLFLAIIALVVIGAAGYFVYLFVAQ